MSASIIEVEVPGLSRKVNLHELPTKKGGTWWTLAAMKNGEKVGLAKGAEFAAADPNDLPERFVVNGVTFPAKLGTTRNGKPKTYVSQVVEVEEGRSARVLVQCSSTSQGFWVYAQAQPYKGAGGIDEADIL